MVYNYVTLKLVVNWINCYENITYKTLLFNHYYYCSPIWPTKDHDVQSLLLEWILMFAE